MFPSYTEVRQALDADVNKLIEMRKLFRSQMAKILGVSGILALIIASFVFTIGSTKLQELYWIVFGISVIVLILVAMVKFDRLRRIFKAKIVSQMTQMLVSQCKLPFENQDYAYTCQYSFERHVSPSYIKKSLLYPYQIDKYFGEDLFSGRLGIADFQFSEIRLVQERTTRDNKGRVKKVDMNMFKGILFVADFHKSFQGVTILRSENVITNSTIGKIFTPIRDFLESTNQGKSMISIDLENEAFNKAFHIVTNDEIEARYLLSINMLERILAFRERHKRKIEISFVDSLICISMDTAKNYFELQVNSSDFERELQNTYEDLIFFFGMVEAFDLNTRIWSKK
jgi:hypothetical protein